MPQLEVTRVAAKVSGQKAFTTFTRRKFTLTLPSIRVLTFHVCLGFGIRMHKMSLTALHSLVAHHRRLTNVVFNPL